MIGGIELPRIRQKNADYMRKDFIAALRAGQGNAGLLQKKELADASGIPYSTLRKRLDNPEKLTVEELRQLIAAIPLAPEAVLAFVGYSAKDINNLAAEI